MRFVLDFATTHGPLIMISSPYAKRGEFWSTYQRHFGPNGDPRILVAQGSSRTFNVSLPRSVVDRAIERDPVSAAAEYGAEFRSDLEAFVSVEIAQSCVSTATFERPPKRELSYCRFADPSAGSSIRSLCVLATTSPPRKP